MFLNHIGYLHLHFMGRCPWVNRHNLALHHHQLGVFKFADAPEGQDTPGQHGKEDKIEYRLPAKYIIGYVHHNIPPALVSETGSTGTTFWFSLSRLTPATTTCSPGFRPLLMLILPSPVSLPVETMRLVTVCVPGW